MCLTRQRGFSPGSNCMRVHASPSTSDRQPLGPNILGSPHGGVGMSRDDRIAVHRRILLAKPLTQEVFRETYALCRRLDERHFSCVGPGGNWAPGQLLQSMVPDIVTTDVSFAPHLDPALSAASSSVRACEILLSPPRRILAYITLSFSARHKARACACYAF